MLILSDFKKLTAHSLEIMQALRKNLRGRKILTFQPFVKSSLSIIGLIERKERRFQHLNRRILYFLRSRSRQDTSTTESEKDKDNRHHRNDGNGRRSPFENLWRTPDRSHFSLYFHCIENLIAQPFRSTHRSKRSDESAVKLSQLPIITFKHCHYGIAKILRNLEIRKRMCKSRVLRPLPGQPFSKFTIFGRQGKRFGEIRVMGIRSIRTEALQNKLSTLIIHWSGFGPGV